MLKFTDEHEWLKIEDGVATVGITSHAAEQLGDLVFVELPEAGATFTKGRQCSDRRIRQGGVRRLLSAGWRNRRDEPGHRR